MLENNEEINPQKKEELKDDNNQKNLENNPVNGNGVHEDDSNKTNPYEHQNPNKDDSNDEFLNNFNFFIDEDKNAPNKNNVDHQDVKVENPIVNEGNDVISNAPKNEDPLNVNQPIPNNFNNQDIKIENPIVNKDNDVINNAPKNEVNNQPPLDGNLKETKVKKVDSDEEIDDTKSINNSNDNRSNKSTTVTLKTSKKQKKEDSGEDENVYDTKVNQKKLKFEGEKDLFKKSNSSKKKKNKIKLPDVKTDKSIMEEILVEEVKSNFFDKTIKGAKKFVTEDVITFVKKVPSKVSGLFEKNNEIILENSMNNIILEESNPRDEKIENIHEGEETLSNYDLALFLLQNNSAFSNAQKQLIGEKLEARINALFLGNLHGIQDFLNTSCFYIFSGSHSLYSLLPKAAQDQVDLCLNNKIKSLFFVEEVQNESLKDIMEGSSPRFKAPHLGFDRNSIEFLKQLSIIFKVTMVHPLAADIKSLILIKMWSVLDNLGGKTGEERQQFYQFYIDLVNKSGLFTSDEKRAWRETWESVKQDAEHYTKMLTQDLDIPEYGNEARIEIQRVKKTIEKNKTLYSSPEFTHEQRRTLSHTISKKLQTAGVIRIVMAECDLLWTSQSPKEMDLDQLLTNYSSVYIRFEGALFFKYLDEENNPCLIEIEMSNTSRLQFDEKMKLEQLGENRFKTLTETELTQIRSITGHKAKLKEPVEMELNGSVTFAGCDLLKFAEFPDEKEFWAKYPLISGVAYARVKNELYYVVAATKKWTEIEISEENLKKFDEIMKKSGEMLLQTELETVRDITGHSPVIMENFGQKETYSLSTKKRVQLTGPYDIQVIEETYFEIVDNYVINGEENDPNLVKKQVTKKKEKIHEKIIDVIKEGNDELLISLLDIYFDLFSDDKKQKYEPDLYSINLLLKNIFGLLEPIYPELAKVDASAIFARNDLREMSELIIQLTKVKSVYLERILPGFLLLAAKQDKLLFVSESTNLIDGNQSLEVFNNVMFSLCLAKEGSNNLLIASCALAYNILDKNRLDEVCNLPNIFAVFRRMAEALSPAVFLQCVRILETKSKFLDGLDEGTLIVFNNLKLRAEFSEKVRLNGIYTKEVIQRENQFNARLRELGIQIPEHGPLSNDSFAALRNALALELADLTYLKAKNLLTDDQIKQIFDEIGAILQAGQNTLSEFQIRFIALYLDQEDIMKVFFSQSGNLEARDGGENHVYFLNREHANIRPYAERIIKAAKELSVYMSPEDKQNYAFAFVSSKTQAFKILKEMGVFSWKREQNFFTKLTTTPVFTNIDSSIMFYRHNGRLLLDPNSEKLPSYLYAAIRQGVDSGVFSLEQVINVIEDIFLKNQGNRQHAWGLFIAIFDELQKLPDERYKKLFMQMLIEDHDHGVTFAKDVEKFLSHNFSVKRCLNYLEGQFLKNLLDKMTDDSPHVQKTQKARETYNDMVVKFEQIKIFAESELTKKPKEKLSNKKLPKKKQIVEIQKIDEDKLIVIEMGEKIEYVNLAFNKALEEGNGQLSKNVVEKLFMNLKPGDPFQWNLKHQHQKLVTPFLEVYFREGKEDEFLDKIILRMDPFHLDSFLDIDAEGRSVLMLAIMNKDPQLFHRVLALFKDEQLKALLTAKDHNGKNIFHYLMLQEKEIVVENQPKTILLIMDNTFFDWNQNGIKEFLSTDCFMNFDLEGRSLLIVAAMLGNQDLFNKILHTFDGKQLAEILNAKDINGKNLIHYLLEQNRLDWITDREQDLLNVDSFMNFNEAGRSLLMSAVISGNQDLFDYVLKTFKGEDRKRLLNAQDNEGLNVLYYLMKYERKDWLSTKKVLDNFSDNPLKDCGDGYTPLHYALLEALDNKEETEETNLLMALLNEFSEGKDFQDWKNIFKIIEDAGLKPLQSAVLMFSTNLEDREVAKKNPEDMLRVILARSPKLSEDEKDIKNNLPVRFNKEETIEFVLNQRKDQDPSSIVVKGWWENGFFGNKNRGIVVEELLDDNDNDTENSNDSRKSHSSNS